MGFFSSLIGSTNPALTNASLGNVNNLAAATGTAAGAAGNELSTITPTLNRWATGGAPGLGPQNLAQKQTRAQLASNASSGSSAEEARLRALRTNNLAGLPAAQTAGAEGAARAAGSTTQDILAKNADLQQQQQQMALGKLAGLYGENINAEMKGYQEMPQALSTARSLQQPGFLTNLANLTGDLSKISSGAVSPMLSMFGGGGGVTDGMAPATPASLGIPMSQYMQMA